MSYKPSDTVIVEFCTSNSGGAATNADSLPTGTVNRNGTDDGAVTVTVVNIDTGRYKASFALPGGYASGDSVSLSVSATVGGTTGKRAWGPWALDGKRLSDVALDGSGRVQVQSGTGAGQISLTAGKVDVSDKTGFSLSNSQTFSSSGTMGGLGNPVTVSGNVTVGGYAAGQDPATLLASSFGTVPGASANAAAVWAAATRTLTSLGTVAPSWYTAPDNADIVTALSDLVALLGRTDPATALTAIKAVTDHLATAIELSGGNYRFTTAALANAPTGGGSTVLEVVTATGAGGPEVTATGSGG